MLRFNKVSFAYGPDDDPVLKDIDLKIGDGESVVVMGSNGSGKTTLALLAAGLLEPTSGSIERHVPDDPAGIVFQNPDNQIVSVTVENELAFPLECRQVESEQVRMHVDEALAQYGFNDRNKTSPNDLSGGEKQKLALASALICRPSLLVLDEPTSHLDANGRKTLEDAVESVRDANAAISVLTITQSSSDALKHDRLIILKDGCIAADSDPERVFADSDLCRSCGIDIPDEILLKSLDHSALTSSPVNRAQEPAQTELVYDLVTIQNLSFKWENSAEVFRGFGMSIRPGKTIGLAAESGGGKTTLAYLLAGLMEPASGDILWQGEKLRRSDLLKKVLYLFQFPERQIFSRTVFDEIAFGLRQQNLSHSEIDERVKTAMQAVSLPFDQFAERAPHLLSGGEMRKVALASSIVLHRPLMIYDEPTAELDSDAVRSLKDTLHEIRNSGGTQIIASHDVDFLFEMCDDFVLLRGGSVGLVCDRDSLYGQPEVFEECGLSAPGIISLAEDEELSEYVRENRIVSVSQLITKLK